MDDEIFQKALWHNISLRRIAKAKRPKIGIGFIRKNRESRSGWKSENRPNPNTNLRGGSFSLFLFLSLVSDTGVNLVPGRVRLNSCTLKKKERLQENISMSIFHNQLPLWYFGLILPFYPLGDRGRPTGYCHRDVRPSVRRPSVVHIFNCLW